MRHKTRIKRRVPDRGSQGLRAGGSGGEGGGISGSGNSSSGIGTSNIGAELGTIGTTSRGRTSDIGGTRSARSLSPYSPNARRGEGYAAGRSEAGAAEAGITGRDRGPTLGIHRAGLGAHLLLPAVSVGAAWLLDLAIRFLENSVEYTAKHHIISGEEKSF